MCLLSFKTKEPGASSRDINGLMDGGAYTSETRSWSEDTPPCAADGGQDIVVLTSREGKIASNRGN